MNRGIEQINPRFSKILSEQVDEGGNTVSMEKEHGEGYELSSSSSYQHFVTPP